MLALACIFVRENGSFSLLLGLAKLVPKVPLDLHLSEAKVAVLVGRRTLSAKAYER